MTRNVLINVLVTGSLFARISLLDNTPLAKLLNYSYTLSCLSSPPSCRFLPPPLELAPCKRKLTQLSPKRTQTIHSPRNETTKIIQEPGTS